MREYGLYIGCKVIKAKFMNENEFLNKIKNLNIPDNKKDRKGYLIEYPDGYQSWSPKEVFENAYRSITIKEIQLINE